MLQKVFNFDLASQKEKLVRDFEAKRKKYFLIGTFLVLLFLTLIYLGPLEGLERLGLIGQRKEEQASYAQEAEDKGPAFVSNELLIKVKREARSRVKEDTGDTGIESINKIGQELGIEKFEKVARVGKNSNEEAEIFLWYKVTFKLKREEIAGRLEQQTENLNLENPAAAVLSQIIGRLRTDPGIEKVEPNYIINIVQEPTPELTPSPDPTPSPEITPSPDPTPSPEITATSEPLLEPALTPIPTPTPTPTPVSVPNDPYYGSTGTWGQSYPDLWGIKKINPEPAWSQTTGSSSVVVADVDTGVDRNHEDLQANMWVNSAETPNNGIDDDANGYVDDYYGWDWVNNDNDPMDDHGHGTHTAGTIAAVGNNGIGVVGVNWTSKIMALKFLSSGGSGSLSDGISALQYAADMSARVSSNSWGCACNTVVMDDAVKYEHDRRMVTVAAAGNSNSDALGFSPASADHAVTVAASDSNDAKASFSNWGEKIDVAAPGVDILSTRASTNPMCDSSRTVGTNYCRVSGTSMATPHAAGLAALLLAKNPTLTNEEIRQIVRKGANDLGSAGKDRDYGYGRINANGSMGLATTHPLTPIITSPRSRTPAAGTFQVVGSILGPNFASYKVEVGNGRQPASWTTLATSTTQVTNGVLATVNSLTLPEGLNIIRLAATDTSGAIWQFQVHDIEVDNMDIAISAPASLVAVGQTSINGTAQTKNGLPFVNYSLEWGSGTSPSSWSTAGISLANGGTQPIANGQLGTWDTSTLTPNQAYTLRLTLNASTTSGSASTTVTADIDIAAGWPKSISRATCPVGYVLECDVSPAIADLNGDGIKELVIASSNKISVFRKDGSNFPGFPAEFPSTDGHYSGAVNVADLDGDGNKEIIATSRILNGPANIRVYRADGTLYPGWPRSTTLTPARATAIGDLDGDVSREIVWLDYNATLHAFRANGTELAGFPKSFPGLRPDRVGSPSIVDLDRDGQAEIAVGMENKLYLIDKNGNILPGWPYSAPDQSTDSGPIPMTFRDIAGAGDIDGDGQLELAAFGSASYECPTCAARWFVLKKDGTLLSGFPKVAPGTDGTLDAYIWYYTNPQHQPVLVDINADGKDEIIGGFFKIFVYDHASGTFRKLTADTTVAPAVSDIDGDGSFEYTANGYCCPNSTYPNTTIVNDDDTIYWQRGPSPQFLHQLLVADMDNDGKMELVGYKSPPSDRDWDGLLVAWTIPKVGANPAQYEWPMLGHDPARTGRQTLGLPTPTPTPTPAPVPSPTPSPSPPGDIIPPTVNITNPVDGSTVLRNSRVTIRASAADNVGVVRVEFLVNGLLKCTVTSSPYTCAWRVGGKRGVSYTLQAKAYDAAGNFSFQNIAVTSSN